ncbi:MAG TPA: lanthionine synthetase LanC family protein [Thermoanaerobaculia bacterium]|jgi:lantibiotic modifying enzyme|nr:lanthionine synthetase LanC family protein [Thermoanaerobaculia bacterium]
MNVKEVGAPFLAAADRLGRRLCRDALWAGGRCNWLGWSLVPHGGAWVPAYRAQTSTLYDGTAGIALFLARLYQLTRDPVERATLEGAVRQVRQAAVERNPEYRFGFYYGVAGVASMAFQVGNILEDEDLIRWGLDLLTGDGLGEPDGTRLDLMVGSAGSIPPLLAFAALTGREELLASALAHGELLLATADRSERGWSWETIPQEGEEHLVGYAHGTAGIACALLELHRVTGESRFREAALEALRYERSHFDPEHGNWPDLRRLPGAPPEGGRRYSVAWCHGAPGIGFSRLRIRRLLDGDEEVAADCEAALATTAASVSAPMIPHLGSFCLCHGAGGNADLLLEASGLLGRPQLRQTAEAVGQYGIAQYGQADMPWPCGVSGTGETPNLMLGLAGVGYFYLRLHAPETVPSLLVLQPDVHPLNPGR